MNTRTAITLTLLASAVAAVQAQTPVVFASFNSAGQGVPAVTKTATTLQFNHASQPNAQNNYNLSLFGTTYNNISFSSNVIDLETSGGSAIAGPGTVNFSTSTGTLLLTVGFDAARINGLTMLSIEESNTTFTSAFGTITSDPSFSFTFANIPGTSNGSFSTTFQAAGVNPQPVPEPATMAALGLGAAAMIRRRRR